MSKDKGQSWTYIKNISGLPSPIHTSSTIYSIKCAGQLCLASGAMRDKELNFPMLLVSRDSGTSWSFVNNYSGLPQNTTDVALFDLSCSGNFCSAAGSQLDSHNQTMRAILLTSHDSGQSWSFVKNIAGFPNETHNTTLNSISCNHNICIAIGVAYKNSLSPLGSDPLLIVSNDSGQTWSSVKNVSGLPDKFTLQMLDLSAIQCSATICTAVGHLKKDAETVPAILRSVDNGQKWTMVHDIIGLPQNSVLTSLAVPQ